LIYLAICGARNISGSSAGHINNMILFIFPSDFFHLVGDVPEKKHPVEKDIKVL
jgi:hypothetical protein